MTGRARHALVLFDVDGYTSIVQTSKLVAPEVEPVKEGQQCVFRHCKTDYKVEVLVIRYSVYTVLITVAKHAQLAQ